MTVERRLRRRAVLAGVLALAADPAAADGAATGMGERLARAARAQVGVTRTYDPAYRRLPYPGGDPPRSTGVCADVPVRAARDGLGLDLQRLVHEDMARAFDAYPSRRRWGLSAPDPSIDHRSVLNLETYWRRCGAELWRAKGPVAGSAFPGRLRPGDFLTWRPFGRGAHVGVVVSAGVLPLIVHNMGSGAQLALLLAMAPYPTSGHYRWPGGGAA